MILNVKIPEENFKSIKMTRFKKACSQR